MKLTKLTGKFNYLVDRVAYETSLDGSDDSFVTPSGSFNLINGGIQLTGIFTDVSPETYNELSEYDRAFLLAKKGGCIISEDTQGFVFVDWFDVDEDLKEVWEKLTRNCAEDKA